MSFKSSYDKPHNSYETQLEKLISRGMMVENHASAIKTLQHISYYRLGLYWHGFEINHTTHELKPGTYFTDVVTLYQFDRELRRLVFHAIERLEISMRAQWVYYMSKHHGPHAHMIKGIHSRDWSKTESDLKKQIHRSDEIFIKRIMEKYSDSSPPIWAVSEVMSFGLLSKWYKNLRDNKVRKAVAHIYDVHPEVLESWMQHLTVVRNNCAHHSRLWNRRFNRVKPKHNRAMSEDSFVEDHRLFNTLTIILYLLDVISADHGWREQFMTLLEAYPSTPLCEMGFPDSWRERKIWQ